MNEAVEPSRRARVLARLLSLAQLVLLGPLTLASTLASALLCFGCICLVAKQNYSSLRAGFQSVFGALMSSWGIFWMVVVVFLPLLLCAGGLALAVVLAVGAVVYPCYAVVR
jgi:hypothetical protein